MWVFIWFVLSAILIGATLWSLNILLKQKKGWEAFSKTRKLTFNRGTFMGPAEINGFIGDYKISLFTAQRAGVDQRTKRYVTVLEVQLIEGLVDGGVMGTSEMVAFMKSLDLLHPYKTDHPAWQDGMFAFVKNDNIMNAFLTPERMDALAQILKTKNADMLVVFNDRELVVRAETSDPMADPAKIDKISKRIMSLCDRLRLTPEERSLYAPQTQTA